MNKNQNTQENNSEKMDFPFWLSLFLLALILVLLALENSIINVLFVLAPYSATAYFAYYLKKFIATYREKKTLKRLEIIYALIIGLTFAVILDLLMINLFLDLFKV